MARSIMTIEDVPISGILTRARDVPSAIQIETRLLDGSYNVQTIGNASTDVQVEFYCTHSVRRQLQGYAVAGTPIKVIFNADAWTGIIKGGALSYEVYTATLCQLSFVLLVQEP